MDQMIHVGPRAVRRVRRESVQMRKTGFSQPSDEPQEQQALVLGAFRHAIEQMDFGPWRLIGR